MGCLFTCLYDNGGRFCLKHLCRWACNSYIYTRPQNCLYSLSMDYRLNTCFIQCSLHNHSICKTEASYWWCISQVSKNSNCRKFWVTCLLLQCRVMQYDFHQSYIIVRLDLQSLDSMEKLGHTDFWSMFKVKMIFSNLNL